MIKPHPHTPNHKILKNTNLFFNLKYPYTRIQKAGLINQFYKKTTPLDLDLSCLLYNQNNQCLDKIWFKKLRDKNHAIRHHGDSLEGYHKPKIKKGESHLFESPPNQESIQLLLHKLPHQITRLDLQLSVYKHSLTTLDQGDISITDNEDNRILWLDFATLKYKYQMHLDQTQNPTKSNLYQTNQLIIAQLHKSIDYQTETIIWHLHSLF